MTEARAASSPVRPVLPGREASAEAAPAAPPSRVRLDAIDAARGVALVGMMMINIGVVRSQTWVDRVWTIPFGRASVLFVALAGVGMTLFLSSRRHGTRRWPVVVWRTVVLLLGGLALQLLTPAVGVILPTYGVLFLGALLWVRLPDRALAALTVLVLFAGPVLVLAHQLPDQHETRAGTLTDDPGTVIHSLVLSGPFPLLVWVVPFLAGMWLGRRDLRDPVTHRRLMLAGGVAAVGAFAVAQVSAMLLGARADRGWTRLLTGAAHGQMPLWLVSSIGSAAFVLGLLLWAWPRIRSWAMPVADLGRLALTLYVAHVLVIAAMGGRIESRLVGIPVTVALVAASTVAATLWVRRFGVGPLERVLRATWLTDRAGAGR